MSVGWPSAVELRTVAFVVLGGWIALAPALKQVLHLPIPWAPAWEMYTGVGAGTCDARYYERTAAGDEPIDRVGLLYGAPWYDVAPQHRRVARTELATLGRKLCGKAGADDVRVDATCGTRRGWVPAMARERNLCALSSPGGRP